jgi:hypothetical protein
LRIALPFTLVLLISIGLASAGAALPVAYSGKLQIGFGMVGLLVLAGALDSDAKRLLTRSRPGHAHPTLEAST